MMAEREPPKVFGREMLRTTNGWSICIATMTLEIYTNGPGNTAAVYSGNCSFQEKHDSEDRDVEWLESTARRIMRECIEIAGPMVAVDTVVPGERYLPVRFK